MSDQGVLTFRGLGASEAKDFIQAVNRIAFAANKSQDTQWKAELASTAFSGDALWWFRNLSPKLQSDWDALQNALLQRYAPEEEELSKDYSDKDSDSATLNLGSDATFERPPAVFVASRIPGPMEGYIKVISDLRTAYIGRELNKAGILGTTSLLTNALRVRLTPDYNPHNIETLNCTGPFGFLGGAHCNTQDRWYKLGPGCTGSMALTSCTADDIQSPAGSRVNGDGTPQRGPIHSAMWNMLADGTLLAQVYRDKGTLLNY
ncbi:hypothetical protein FS837_003142 [Tulasnella sp. UAMH 9824]|nr:hypothetical protein FS837_003142 [Tulasnella sp. UAMH 9824]